MPPSAAAKALMPSGEEALTIPKRTAQLRDDDLLRGYARDERDGYLPEAEPRRREEGTSTRPMTLDRVLDISVT